MLICMDGGGTKTEALLVCEDGRVLERRLGGPSNPNALGAGPAVTQVKALILALLKEHGGGEAPISAVFLGLSGAGMKAARAPFEEMLQKTLPNAQSTRVGSDALGALSSGVRKRDGVVLIAGTGSAAFCRRGRELFQTGGWGQLIDDAGSGYDIARKGFRAVLRAHDGRAPQTALSKAFNDKLGAPVWESIPQIYQGGKQLIANFAPLVLEMENDPVADRIVQEAADDLTAMALAAGKHLSQDAPCPVVLAGSIWKNDRLRLLVTGRLPNRFEWIRPTLPPVYGATVEACADAGGLTDDGFEARFRASYPACE